MTTQTAQHDQFS